MIFSYVLVGPDTKNTVSEEIVDLLTLCAAEVTASICSPLGSINLKGLFAV